MDDDYCRAPAQTDPHTYTARDVVLPRGNSGLAGKASDSEEGVAACILAKSEQNIPAMWLIPSPALPQRCFFFLFFFFSKAELKHTQSAEGQRGFTEHASSHTRANKTSAQVHRTIAKPATDFHQGSQLIYNRGSRTQEIRIKSLETLYLLQR